jgi:6-phosphogluconolactonase
MHRHLASPGIVEQIPWLSTWIFWVDERMVGAHLKDSNFGNARSDFLDLVPIPDDHIFPMPYWMTPDNGAVSYAKTLQAFFHRCKQGAPVFDLIFLGLGTDGHTASLFPQTDPSVNTRQWVRAVKGGQPDVYRLTLNYGIINQARHVCFLVSGASKAKVVKSVLENTGGNLPAQRIHPQSGQTTWICDQPAASLLDRVPSMQQPTQD